MIRTILTILLASIVFITFNLGMDYVNLGYGLHPAIAFPIATLAAIAALTVHHWVEINDRPYKAK